MVTLTVRPKNSNSFVRSCFVHHHYAFARMPRRVLFNLFGVNVRYYLDNLSASQ